MNRDEKDYRELSLLEIIKRFFFSKITSSVKKQSFYAKKETPPPPPPPDNVSINHIAIILDDRVEEVIRCENRLAALLLSEPSFVEFNPEQTQVFIGKTEYVSNEFKNSEEVFPEEHVDEIIQKEKEKRKNV